MSEEDNHHDLLHKLSSEWKIDCVIDPLDLDGASLVISKLNQKYLDYYSKIARKIVILNKQMRSLSRTKQEFYSGRAVRPFQEKLSNAKEMNVYVEGDDEVNDLMAKLELAQAALDMCKEIIKTLHERNWTIKNTIEYQKFQSGSN